MNKAKAYNRLKLKQKHSNSAKCWIELAPALDSPKLPLQVIKPLNTAQEYLDELTETSPNENTNSATMFGVKRYSMPRNFSSDINKKDNYTSESQGASQNISTTLPLLMNTNNPRLSSQYESRQTFTGASAKVNSIRRPATSDIADSLNRGNTKPGAYTVLQAKIDSLILPNPVKRKASRSFSGSSSGLHGRKLTITTRHELRNSSGRVLESENKTPVQFPAASKMRQLLTRDRSELNRETPVNRSTVSQASNRETRTKEINNAARFYFPSYTKQKTLKITTDPNTQVFKLASAMKPPRVDTALPKTVSFRDETSIKSSQHKPLQPQHAQQSPASEPQQAEPLTIQPAAGLALTIQNLEMYNTMSRTTELRIPSDDDSRTTSWVRERQLYVTSREGERCENIPELEENVNSAEEGDETDSDSERKT